MTYTEQLQDERWHVVRKKILQRDGFRCKYCFIDKKQLHVHHKEYIDKLLAWEYPEYLLITLCCECHEFVHGISNRIYLHESKYEYLIYRPDNPTKDLFKKRISELQEMLKSELTGEDMNLILGNIKYLQQEIKKL